MEDQTQTAQPIQDQTVDTAPVDTTVNQPEVTPVEQTPTETAPVEQISEVPSADPAPVDVPVEPKRLTGADVLASYGLVEIYDARLGAYCQVKKEDAEKMLQSLEVLKAALGV